MKLTLRVICNSVLIHNQTTIIEIMNKVKWILKNGIQVMDLRSFPAAIQEMMKIVRKTIASNGNLDRVKSGFQIVGPPNGKGEPMIYNYDKAMALADAMGIIDPDGNFNKKAAFGKK